MMAVHIDRSVTEVIPEPEPQTGGEREDSRWREQERVRAALARLRTLQLRTRAEGFDD